MRSGIEKMDLWNVRLGTHLSHAISKTFRGEKKGQQTVEKFKKNLWLSIIIFSINDLVITDLCSNLIIFAEELEMIPKTNKQTKRR